MVNQHPIFYIYFNLIEGFSRKGSDHPSEVGFLITRMRPKKLRKVLTKCVFVVQKGGGEGCRRSGEDFAILRNDPQTSS